MTPKWSSSAASVTGSRHRQRGQGNQDGFALCCRGERAIAVVTDGCGSAPHSQVGSQLGAQLWLRALSRYVAEPACVSLAKAEVLAHLELLASSMAMDPSEAIRSHFLFTTVAAIVRGADVEVFAIGDGVVCLDDELIEMGPFAGDQPPYLAYELLGAPQAASMSWKGSARTVVIATDGAIPSVDLVSLGHSDAIFDRRDALRRRLVALGTERTAVDWERQVIDRIPGVLIDDTTVIALRRDQ